MRPSTTRLFPLIVFLVRRRTMSSMSLIFDAIGCCEDSSQVIRLSAELIDELGATFNGSVRATDASDWGMAGVVSEQPVLLCREFCRHTIQKSVWSQLLPPSKAWLRTKGKLQEDEELPEETFDCHPLFELLARCIPHKETWRLQHRKPVHINIGELRAHLREESYLAPNSPSSRQLYGLDSKVSLGCLIKGRSSSKSLYQELLRSLPIIIGSDLYTTTCTTRQSSTEQMPPPEMQLLHLLTERNLLGGLLC